MNWVHLFTSFEGRISRQPFWIAWAVLIAAEFVLWLLNQQINDDRIAAVTDLVICYPQFAVCAKRGHDRDTPAWVVGLFFGLSVVVDLLMLGGWVTTASLQQPGTLAVPLFLIFLAVAVFALVLIVDLGFRRGTHGPNRYGPDPLELQT